MHLAGEAWPTPRLPNGRPMPRRHSKVASQSSSLCVPDNFFLILELHVDKTLGFPFGSSHFQPMMFLHH